MREAEPNEAEPGGADPSAHGHPSEATDPRRGVGGAAGYKVQAPPSLAWDDRILSLSPSLSLSPPLSLSYEDSPGR